MPGKSPAKKDDRRGVLEKRYSQSTTKTEKSYESGNISEKGYNRDGGA